MMSVDARVGIVIPTYNAEAFIGETIQSLRAQSFTDWTALVVDDGSSDDTATVAQQAAAGDDRISYLRQPNGGRPTACNRGEHELPASCEYIAFLDADDVFETDFLETLTDYLDQHPNVDAAACQFVRMDSRGRFFDSVYLSRQHRHRTRWVPGRLGFPRDLGRNERYTPLVTFLSCTGTGPWTLFRRDAFRQIGGFDERLRARQDTDFFCRFSLQHAIHYLPDVLYRYRLHGGNITNDRKRNGASVQLLKDKWSDFKADHPDAQRELALSRRYVQAVHEPLRDVRSGLRMLTDRAFRTPRGLTNGAAMFSRGLAQFGWRYPIYLARWHRPLQQLIHDRDQHSRQARHPESPATVPDQDLSAVGANG